MVLQGSLNRTRTPTPRTSRPEGTPPFYFPRRFSWRCSGVTAVGEGIDFDLHVESGPILLRRRRGQSFNDQEARRFIHEIDKFREAGVTAFDALRHSPH